MKIGIIGAGHAGVSAAQTLAKEGAEVFLFSNEKCVPYYRPRIPSVAFAQSSPEDAYMHPENWYSENNIKILLDTEVISIDEKCILKTSDGNIFSFDKIIFSHGAKPIIPPFALGVNNEKIVPLWNMDNALSIHEKIGKIKNIAIIGGGVIGLEAALRAIEAGFRVKVIERAEMLLSRNLNSSISEILSKYLKEKSVEILTGISVEKITEKNNKLEIQTDKQNHIEAELAIMSIGAGFDCTLPKNANIKCTKKISVNEFLKSDNENFFAAGDIAEVSGAPSVCSAIRAVKQGKTAAINSVSDNNKNIFIETPITLQVKFNDFFLLAAGTPTTEDKEIILEKNLEKKIFRLINIDKEKKITSVQMLGSNQDFKKFEKLFLEGGKYE